MNPVLQQCVNKEIAVVVYSIVASVEPVKYHDNDTLNRLVKAWNSYCDDHYSSESSVKPWAKLRLNPQQAVIIDDKKITPLHIVYDSVSLHLNSNNNVEGIIKANIQELIDNLYPYFLEYRNIISEILHLIPNMHNHNNELPYIRYHTIPCMVPSHIKLNNIPDHFYKQFL